LHVWHMNHFLHQFRSIMWELDSFIHCLLHVKEPDEYEYIPPIPYLKLNPKSLSLKFKGGSSAWCTPPPFEKKIFTYFFFRKYVHYRILIELIHERIQLQRAKNLTPTMALPWIHWRLKDSSQTSCPLMRPFQKILDPPLWFPHVSIRQVHLQYYESKTHHFVVVVEGFHFIRHYVFSLTSSNFTYFRGSLKVDSPFDQYWTPLPSLKSKNGLSSTFERQT
jgi:hypothetical protein